MNFERLFEECGITPGPWKVCDIEDGTAYGINGDNGLAVSWWSDFKAEGIERKMDAILISKSPEMLKALIFSTMLMIDLTDWTLFEYINSNVKLIESATGKTWKEIKEILEGSQTNE